MDKSNWSKDQKGSVSPTGRFQGSVFNLLELEAFIPDADLTGIPQNPKHASSPKCLGYVWDGVKYSDGNINELNLKDFKHLLNQKTQELNELRKQWTRYQKLEKKGLK